MEEGAATAGWTRRCGGGRKGGDVERLLGYGRLRRRRWRFQGWVVGEVRRDGKGGEISLCGCQVWPAANFLRGLGAGTPREVLHAGASVGLPATISGFISRRVRMGGAGGQGRTQDKNVPARRGRHDELPDGCGLKACYLCRVFKTIRIAEG